MTKLIKKKVLFSTLLFCGIILITLFISSEEKSRNSTSSEQYEVLKRLADEAIEADTLWRNDSQGVLDRTANELNDAYRHLKFLKYIGKEAPDFNYEDRNNQVIGIKDFIGKWILIDVWASWCKPCIGDISSMKKLEESFKSENIIFLGVSIDSEELKEKWLNVLDKKEPSGIQILTGNKSAEFQNLFAISTIPRYILINPEGIIVEMDLPRPYDPSMEALIRRHFKLHKEVNIK